jgi:hypothetical protein
MTHCIVFWPAKMTRFSDLMNLMFAVKCASLDGRGWTALRINWHVSFNETLSFNVGPAADYFSRQSGFECRQRAATSVSVFNDENGMNTLGEKSGR